MLLGLGHSSVQDLRRADLWIPEGFTRGVPVDQNLTVH